MNFTTKMNLPRPTMRGRKISLVSFSILIELVN